MTFRVLCADDQIVLSNGQTVNGQVLSVSGDQVMVSTRSSNGGTARLPFRLSDIKAITMAAPPEVTQLAGAPPAQVIATLTPIVKRFAGLPADWVLTAMGQLADAYRDSNQPEQAAGIYAQINDLYPNSPFQAQAVAGTAKLDLQQGRVDAALAELQPVIDKANQNLAPSASEGQIYANAFLVYGQVLQAKKQLPQALEAYLTVKTMFYQNPALVSQAEQLAKALQDENPGVGVE